MVSDPRVIEVKIRERCESMSSPAASKKTASSGVRIAAGGKKWGSASSLATMRRRTRTNWSRSRDDPRRRRGRQPGQPWS